MKVDVTESVSDESRQTEIMRDCIYSHVMRSFKLFTHLADQIKEATT